MTQALRKAIKLREWTRRALDLWEPGTVDENGDVRRLNRMADAALAKLTDAEFVAYFERFGPEVREVKVTARVRE